MRIMKSYVTFMNLFIWSSGLAITRSMQYRANFMLGAFITVLYSFIGPTVQLLLFTQTKGFPGWNLDQIIVFQGVLLLTVGMKNTIFGNAKNQFINLIRSGEFDRFLLRPYPPMQMLMATSFSSEGIGALVAGIVIIVFVLIKINLVVTIWMIILFVVCIAIGLLFNVALDIIHCSLIILTVADGGVQGIMNAYLRFSEFPLQIYPKVLQILFVTLLPLGIFVYFPAQVLLGRIDTTLIFCIVCVIAFYVISLRIWKSVLKKYISAGG